MIIRRGRHAGCKAELLQFANDWMTVNIVLSDGFVLKSQVISPTNVTLEPDEYKSEFLPYGDTIPVERAGTFFDEFKINEDHTRFTRVKGPRR